MCAARGPNLRQLLDLGLRARKDGDRKAAFAYFEMAVAANPRHVQAKLEAARELANMSRLEEAEAMFRRVLADDPDHVQALLGLGNLLRDLSRLDEAETLLQRAADLAPRNVRALLSLARLLRRRGDRTRARALLDAAAAADPVHIGVQVEIAIELRDQGDFDEARSKLDAIVNDDPANLYVWMQIGQIERRRGRHQAACDAFKRVVQHDPNHLQAMVEIAVEERALGHPAESERTLRRALQMDPNHLGALMQLAEHAWIAENDQASLEWCYRAIAGNPRQLAPYLNASRAAAGLGRADTAFSMLDQAATIFGADPAIGARRVELLKLAGEWNEARAVLASLPEDAQRNFRLWVQRVNLDISVGDYDTAAEALRNPPANTTQEWARVEVSWGHLAEAQWRFGEAISHYRRAIELNPSEGGSHMELARACLLTFDIDGAREALRSAISLSSSRNLLRGQSLNVSQSLLGQILNEFMLDRATVNRLRDLNGLSIAERVSRAQEIVRQVPDNTAVAMYLLIAMRQAGSFLNSNLVKATEATGARIPRRIIQYWDAAAPPRTIIEIMQSWRNLHPNWDYQRFDDKLAREFIGSKHSVDVLRAYLRAPHPAQKADLFRLAYLFVEGGFYVDADDRSLANIETVVPPHAALAVYQEDLASIGNNFLGATPGDPVIERALDTAVEAVNRGDRDVFWLSTGPGLLARVFAQFLSDPQTSAELLDRAVVLERGQLGRAVAVHCQLNYKKTDKHWVLSAFRTPNGQSGKAGLMPTGMQ